MKILVKDLRCLEDQKLEFHHQLQSIQDFQQEVTSNLLNIVLTKLIFVWSFGIFVPFDAEKTHLLLFKKERITRFVLVVNK